MRQRRAQFRKLHTREVEQLGVRTMAVIDFLAEGAHLRDRFLDRISIAANHRQIDVGLRSPIADRPVIRTVVLRCQATVLATLRPPSARAGQERRARTQVLRPAAVALAPELCRPCCARFTFAVGGWWRIVWGLYRGVDTPDPTGLVAHPQACACLVHGSPRSVTVQGCGPWTVTERLSPCSSHGPTGRSGGGFFNRTRGEIPTWRCRTGCAAHLSTPRYNSPVILPTTPYRLCLLLLIIDKIPDDHIGAYIE